MKELWPYTLHLCGRKLSSQLVGVGFCWSSASAQSSLNSPAGRFGLWPDPVLLHSSGTAIGSPPLRQAKFRVRVNDSGAHLLGSRAM